MKNSNLREKMAKKTKAQLLEIIQELRNSCADIELDLGKAKLDYKKLLYVNDQLTSESKNFFKEISCFNQEIENLKATIMGLRKSNDELIEKNHQYEHPENTQKILSERIAELENELQCKNEMIQETSKKKLCIDDVFHSLPPNMQKKCDEYEQFDEIEEFETVRTTFSWPFQVLGCVLFLYLILKIYYMYANGGDISLYVMSNF